MKKAGELLAAIFDENFVKKAQGYSDLSRSWKSVAGENIAAHSRIVDLVRSVLVVEADHPGWIQILQTKQKSLLEGVSRRFPDLSIMGISFRLSRDTAGFPAADSAVTPAVKVSAADSTDLLSAETELLSAKLKTEQEDVSEAAAGDEVSTTDEATGEATLDTAKLAADLYARITDAQFRETFKRLEQDIRARNKGKR